MADDFREKIHKIGRQRLRETGSMSMLTIAQQTKVLDALADECAQRGLTDKDVPQIHETLLDVMNNIALAALEYKDVEGLDSLGVTPTSYEVERSEHGDIWVIDTETAEESWDMGMDETALPIHNVNSFVAFHYDPDDEEFEDPVYDELKDVLDDDDALIEYLYQNRMLRTANINRMYIVRLSDNNISATREELNEVAIGIEGLFEPGLIQADVATKDEIAVMVDESISDDGFNTAMQQYLQGNANNIPPLIWKKASEKKAYGGDRSRREWGEKVRHDVFLKALREYPTLEEWKKPQIGDYGRATGVYGEVLRFAEYGKGIPAVTVWNYVDDSETLVPVKVFEILNRGHWSFNDLTKWWEHANSEAGLKDIENFGKEASKKKADENSEQWINDVLLDIESKLGLSIRDVDIDSSGYVNAVIYSTSGKHDIALFHLAVDLEDYTESVTYQLSPAQHTFDIVEGALLDAGAKDPFYLKD